MRNDNNQRPDDEQARDRRFSSPEDVVPAAGSLGLNVGGGAEMEQPERSNRPRYLVTSALPYINGVKHLGNFVGSLLPADVYARFRRQCGDDVLFVCATDEHGTPAELAAFEASMTVQDYCQRMHEVQADVLAKFKISFDHFGRSSSSQNREMTQEIFRLLDENGFIEEREILACYSPTDRRFLPDRYILGTCPKCGYESARGDQCESCTCVLDPTDLLNPRSAISGSSDIEIRNTRHLFLRQSALTDEVRDWVEGHSDWPRLVTSIAYKWLDEGIRDRCITRDLAWGIPVPKPGFENKVFYVWFDAPIEYIGATKEWADARGLDWEDWWRKPSEVRLIQFMAKDNVPFHTVTWPATMLGTRQKWVMADFIKGFSWLNYYGGKFSTSQSHGVFLDAAIELYPADIWRYSLLSMAPETDDSDFVWERLQTAVNKDLVGKYGNFVTRVLKLTDRHYGRKVPAGGTNSPREEVLLAHSRELVGEYQQALSKMEYRRAVSALRSLWDAGNAYIDETAPWDLVKSGSDYADVVLRTSINLIYLYAVVAWPIMPASSEVVLSMLNLPADETPSSVSGQFSFDWVAPLHAFAEPNGLFERIPPEAVDALRERFGS